MAALKRTGPDVATVLIVALCAAWYCKTSILAPVHWLPIQRDFIHYHHAAQLILSGRSPYENPYWFYPPITAFLLVPFGLTDYVTARWIWFVLSQIFLLLAAWVLWRAGPRDRAALCSLACVWAFGGSGEETLEGGQISMLLVLLLAAAYADFSWRRGAALGGGFVLKYLPGAAALALILNRDRRGLAVFFAVAAVGVLLPWAVLVVCFPGPYAPLNPHYWMGTPHPQSWSIPSVALRIADPPRNDGHLPHNWEAGNRVDALRLTDRQALLSVTTAAVVLAVGVGVLIVLCGGKLTREQTPWAMAGLIALSLAAAPVSWTHYQVLQYPGIALLLGDSIRRHAWRSAVLVAVLFVLLYPAPYEVFRWFDRHGGLGIGSPAAIYLWTSVAPLATLGVFAVSVRRMRATVTQI